MSTKQTPIGLLPAEWDVRLFGEVVQIKKGQVDPTVEPYSSMIHVGPENIEEGSGRLKARDSARKLSLISGKYLFDQADVLYSKIRPYLRKVALPDFRGLCSADMYPVRPSSKLLLRGFLFYYLLDDRFTRQAISHQGRTGIPKINREQLNQIGVPLPHPSVQEEIAEYLSTVDRKIAGEEQRRDALDQLFKSLLHELMRGRIRLTDWPDVA